MHVSRNKNIIVKTENTPRIGETVVNENLKVVGTVFDIFGPTSSPYVAIRPTTSEPERLLNQRLYVLPSRGERRKRND